MWYPTLCHVVFATLIQHFQSSFGIIHHFQFFPYTLDFLILFSHFTFKFVYMCFILVDNFFIHQVVHLYGGFSLFEFYGKVLILFLEVVCVFVVDGAGEQQGWLWHIVPTWLHHQLGGLIVIKVLGVVEVLGIVQVLALSIRIILINLFFELLPLFFELCYFLAVF